MKRVFLFARLVLLLAPFAAALEASAEVKAVGRFKDWRVFTEGSGRDLVCFAAVDADDAAPRNIDHGDVNFYIATWKSGNRDQPSIKVGYKLRTDISPLAIVGRDRFRMFASGTEAFIADQKDAAFLAAVKKGSELRIESASADNTRTAYHFSLKGSTDAMTKARALCR